jgi:hypothetical protein
MQSKLTCLIQIITFSCICNFACTKKNSPAPTPTPSPTKEVPVVPTPVAEKSHIPVKLEAENTMITLKYKGNTMNISEIENSDGTKELYMYNDKDQLKEYDRYEKTERMYVVYYLRDQDGYVTKGNQNKVESNGTVLTPIGSYRIEYTADRKISKVSWYDNSNKLLSEAIRTYSDDGTSLKITTTGQNAGVVDYLFDGKKAWCSRMNYNQVLSIESLPGLLLSNTGNISKSVGSSADIQSKTYTYTYDPENYPTSWIEADAKGSKRTIKVTYR